MLRQAYVARLAAANFNDPRGSQVFYRKTLADRYLFVSLSSQRVLVERVGITPLEVHFSNDHELELALAYQTLRPLSRGRRYD